jgi:Uma2 family endonuclease
MGLIPELTRIVFGPDWNGARLTPEEFDAIEEYDEDYSYELVHGVVVVNPIPLGEETGPNEMLGYLLLAYKNDHPQGKALDNTLPQQYVRTGTSRRLADRIIWAGLGRTPHRLNDRPTIAVEFVSGSKRDRKRDYEEKRKEYMEVGISEYWIIDRFRRIMAVISNQPDGPNERLVHESETYQTPLLPGFELPLARLLAVADEWAHGEPE